MMGYNIPAGAKKPPEQSQPLRKYVRCLGPGKEHMFWSDDPCRHRLCARCAAKINLMVMAEPRTIVLQRGGARVED